MVKLNGGPSAAGKKLILVIQVLFFLLILLVMANRVRFGIDFTDCSWYVAEPFLVAKGAVPYCDLWSQASGFTIPLACAFDLFLRISGGTDGIFFFAGYLYMAWVLCACIAASVITKQKLFLFTPLLCLSCFYTFFINYNSIGCVYLLLSSLILFCYPNTACRPDAYKRGLIAGTLVARAVIGTPSAVVPCLLTVFILLFSKQRRLLLWYIAGGILSAVIVVSWCSILGGGVAGLYQGLKSYLADGAYLNIPSNISWANEFSFHKKPVAYFIIWAIPMLICRLFCKNVKTANTVCFALMSASFLWGLQYGAYCVYYCCFQSIFAMLFLQGRRAELSSCAIISVLYIFFYAASSSLNVYGSSGRQFFLLAPCMMSLWSLYIYIYAGELDIKWKLVPSVLLALLCILQVRTNYYHVYRDAPLGYLTSTVADGIWKGCKTTPERAADVVSIENCIREMTAKDDKVLFLDWASFGYLMSNGQAFTPSSLDNMCYTYGVNNPEIMYDYFKLKADIPDKVIYIDFGRDELLSIEKPDWKFNDFINENYAVERQENLNGYRVLMYTRSVD